jgi:hypothetical protein
MSAGNFAAVLAIGKFKGCLKKIFFNVAAVFPYFAAV